MLTQRQFITVSSILAAMVAVAILLIGGTSMPPNEKIGAGLVIVIAAMVFVYCLKIKESVR